MATIMPELRGAVSRQLVGNRALLDAVVASGSSPPASRPPSRPAPQPRPRPASRETPWQKDVLRGGMDSVQGVFHGVVDASPEFARSPGMKTAVKRIAGAPGYLLDAGTIMTADDKGQAMAEAAGGIAGSYLGAATGPAAPAGVPLGGYGGSKLGGYLYRHRRGIGDILYLERYGSPRMPHGAIPGYDF